MADATAQSDAGGGSSQQPPPPCPELPCKGGEPCVRTLAGDGAPGRVDGPAAQARFSSPSAIAVGPGGAVYVGDSGNGVVRVIAGGYVSTLSAWEATGTAPQFARIQGLAVDAQGRVYLADGNNIWVIHQGVATILPTKGKILEPVDVALGSNGALYVVDQGNVGCLFLCSKQTRRPPRIFRVQGGVVSELPESLTMSQQDIKPDTTFLFATPRTVAVASNGTIYMPTETGVRAILAGVATDQAISPISVITNIAVDGQGGLFGAVPLGHRVGHMAQDGTLTTTPPLPPKPLDAVLDSGCTDGPASSARFYAPTDVAVNLAGTRLLVTDEFNHRVRVITF